ncbi:MAG: DUF362 domain-containing protein [Candidatus Hodarchaeota archaeon]
MGESEVYFGSVQHGKLHAIASLAAKVDKIVELLDFSTIKKNDKVAIKMHLGFQDGYQTVPVFFVRRIVDAVKKTGGWPFVTDNPTAVYNAVYRGYTQETCGCPIIPVAGVKDGYTYKTRVDYKNVDELDMAGVLHDADILINLTHAKGHGVCGYGGAIKNLALGGYSGPTRWEKLHGVHEYTSYWDQEKSTPEHSKKLVESCPYNALKYDEEKHKLSLNLHNCNQCLECIKADKGIGSLQIKQESFTAFQELEAIAAKKILDTFEDDKKFHINFVIEVTAFCDCCGIVLPCVVNDIGVVGSRDIVTVDTATLDLIAKEGLIERNIPPFFKHVNLDSSAELHPFQRIHGPFKDPYIVIDFGENLGMGSRKYKLIEILSPEETIEMKVPERVYERQPSFF